MYYVYWCQWQIQLPIFCVANIEFKSKLYWLMYVANQFNKTVTIESASEYTKTGIIKDKIVNI